MKIVLSPTLGSTFVVLEKDEKYDGPLVSYTPEEVEYVRNIDPHYRKVIHLCKQIFKARVSFIPTDPQPQLSLFE